MKLPNTHTLSQKLLVVFLLLFPFPTLQAQTLDSLALNRLSDAVLELQNSELMRNGTLAFCLKSSKNGRTILALNHEQSVPSASTLKLVSTATVLSVLGGDYTYKTYLEYDGQIDRDTLRGDLYLRGTGDPSLGSEPLQKYPRRRRTPRPLDRRRAPRGYPLRAGAGRGRPHDI